jgi:uncharacterized glyoxalase superfamily protein PhnB
VSLTVRNLPESLRWYTELLGFTLDRRMERDGELRGAVITAGNVRMLLNQDDGAKGWDRVKGQGFSMSIATEQDVDAIARRIVDGGGTLVTEPADMPWGARAFRLHDPDGYQLSISRFNKPS